MAKTLSLKFSRRPTQGNVLLITLIFILVTALLLWAAMDFTSQVARNTQRILIRQQAESVADSLMEVLFAQFKDEVNNYKSSLGNLAPQTVDFSGTNGKGGYLNFKTSTSKVPLGSAFPELSSYFSSVANYSTLHLDDASLGVVTTYAIAAIAPNTSASSTTGRVMSSGTMSFVRTLKPNGNYEGQAYRYLATVCVQLPAKGQNVTVQLSRIFEFEIKSFLNYAIFSNIDLEIHPGAAMTISGPVHSNSNMYVGDGGGTLNFTDTVDAVGLIVNGRMSPANSGTSTTPTDPAHGDSPSTPTGTGWTNKIQHSAPVTPLGVNSSSFNTGDTNPNNDSYHDIVELPVFPLTSNTDPLSPGDNRTNATQAFDFNNLQTMRLSNVADYVITIDNATHDPTVSATAFTVQTVSGSSVVTLGTNSQTYQAFQTVIATDQSPIQDQRESASSGSSTVMNLTNVDVKALKSAMDSGKIVPLSGTGAGIGIFIVDNRAKKTYTKVTNPKYNSGGAFPAITSNTTVFTGTFGQTEPAIRLLNGATLPSGGLTIVTPNPVYVQGDYNTGGVYGSGTVSQPSCITYNHNWPQAQNGQNWTDQTTHDPTTLLLSKCGDTSQAGVQFNDPNNNTTSTYYWQPAAIVGDAITVLSNAWVDTNSTKALSGTGSIKPAATSTVINAAFFAGNVATTNNAYSGGIENFPRFLESWSSASFYYVGSMVLLYNSIQATGAWPGTGTVYNPPTRRWAYDKFFMQYGVPLLSGGGSANGGAAGGGSNKVAATGGGKVYQRKQWITRTVQ